MRDKHGEKDRADLPAGQETPRAHVRASLVEQRNLSQQKLLEPAGPRRRSTHDDTTRLWMAPKELRHATLPGLVTTLDLDRAERGT